MDEIIFRRNIGYGAAFPGCKYRYSDSWIKSLSLSAILNSHAGCVNSLNWSEDGCYLISGSDDTTVKIWSASANGPTASPNVSISTGHTSNIFCAQYLPSSSNSKFVTASADAKIKVFDLQQSKTTSIHTFTCFTDATKKICTEPGNPHFFMACSEDGSIRCFDLRKPHNCSVVACKSNILVQVDNPTRKLDDSVEIHSISLSQMFPAYFIAGGADKYCRLFDRRFLQSNTDKDKSIRKYSSSETSSTNRNTSYSRELITSLKFATDSMDFVVSYSEGNIFIGNALDHKQQENTIHLNENKRAVLPSFDVNSSDLLEVTSSLLSRAEDNFRNQSYSQALYLFEVVLHIVEQSRKNEFSNFPHLNEFMALLYHNIAVSLICNSKDNTEKSIELVKKAISNKESRKSQCLLILLHGLNSNVQQVHIETEQYFVKYGYSPIGGFAEIEYISHSDVFDKLSAYLVERFPLKSYNKSSYKGHVNSQTIKDVGFFGHNHIISGSDDGNFFIWNKKTCDITLIAKSNSDGSVNCISEHPFEPKIAVSGIDDSIKIWSMEKNECSKHSVFKCISHDSYEAIAERNQELQQHGNSPFYHPMILFNADDGTTRVVRGCEYQ